MSTWEDNDLRESLYSADGQGFLNYTRFMVSRQKNEIKYWEFWNEPNIGYWQPNVELKERRAVKGREYGHVLCQVADVVHEIDTQAKMI